MSNSKPNLPLVSSDAVAPSSLTSGPREAAVAPVASSNRSGAGRWSYVFDQWQRVALGSDQHEFVLA